MALVIFHLFELLFYFGVTACDAQDILLTLLCPQGSLPADLEECMKCQELNLS